jgi:hypothetical protein
LEKKSFKVEIEVPPNATGEVVLPGKEGKERVGSGKLSFESEFVDGEEWPPKAIYAPYAQYEDMDD